LRVPTFEAAPVAGMREAGMREDGLVASDRPFAVTLDFSSGSLTPARGKFVRRLSDMASLYEDQEAVKRALGSGDDPVIYVGRSADVPERPGHLAFLTTTIAAGTVGSEFYMTRGHHHVQDSGELYLGLSGQGIMVMESREGAFAYEALAPSVSVYVPPRWAHRTVNTGTEPLVFLASYFAGAGHDYSSVERSGFSCRVYRGASGPEVRPPRLPSGAAQ
jgi:glucose-6-phosphate isomerase, archaeal